MSSERNSRCWERKTIIRRAKSTKQRQENRKQCDKSQPNFEIPSLWHSILSEDRRQIIKERKPRRKEQKQRDKKMARKRGREEEASGGRKLRRTEIRVTVVDKRHRHKIQLRRTVRKPVRLIDVCNTN
jgi:hypothetical protein